MRKNITRIVGPRRAAKERVWKILNIVVVATMVANVSLLGSLVRPKAASAAPAQVDLDQCRNGAVGSPDNCDDSTWVNGNAGSSNSHYSEGESIPYRVVLENLPTGTPITLTLGYDVKHSDKHAVDFLTHYDRTDVAVDPIDGVTGVSGLPNTFAIPTPPSYNTPVAGQPVNAFNALPAGERVFSIWNGSITAMQYVNNADGNLGDLSAAQSETRVQVTFTVTDPTAVISWGGHIGSRLDWGLGNSAGGISGSPYHMRLISWSEGNIGNTDRSLSANAIVVPATIVVQKQTVPDGSTETFAFTGDAAGTIGDGETIAVTNLQPDTYTVTETTKTGWTLDAITCDDNTGSQSDVTPSNGNVGTRTATFELSEGETVTCVFTNEQDMGDVTIVKEIRNPDNGSAVPSDWTFTLHPTQGGNDITGIPHNTPTSVPTGFYTVSEQGPSQYSFLYAYGDCSEDGDIYLEVTTEGATCTFVNETYAAHGQKWNDLDGNSTWDTGEPALNGWTVFLDANGNGALDGGEMSMVTQSHDDGIPLNDDNGWYWFQDLEPGTYQICEVQQGGWSQTYPQNANNNCHTQHVGFVQTETPPTCASQETLNSVLAPSCNFGNQIIPITPVTTITLDKTGPATATPGQSFTYSLAWTVAGNTSATNAVITDPLPANTTFVSATEGGTFAAGTVTWNLGTKNPVVSGTVSVTVIVNPGLTSSTTLTNTGTFDTDQTPPVNDTVVTTVTVPQVLGVSAEANLGITKSVDQPIANPGDTVTYTIVVSNTGDADATNVVVTDNLPDGFTFVDTGKASKTWSLGTLAAGASETLTYQVKIGGSVTAGEYINRAFVTADFFDPIAAEAVVTVKVPQVLGLATTGAGLKDLVIFILGIGLLSAGFIGFQQLRRRSATTA